MHTQGVKAAPAQRNVGYKGSTEAGSAPKTCVSLRVIFSRLVAP
jgi:hypothetical protein